MKSLEHLFPDEHADSRHEEVIIQKKKITYVIEYKNNFSKSLHESRKQSESFQTLHVTVSKKTKSCIFIITLHCYV